MLDGVGRFQCKCKIKVKDNMTSVVRPPRRMPLNLKPKLELKELECHGLIAKVNQPTDWVSNLVIVDKAMNLS